MESKKCRNVGFRRAAILPSRKKGDDEFCFLAFDGKTECGGCPVSRLQIEGERKKRKCVELKEKPGRSYKFIKVSL